MQLEHFTTSSILEEGDVEPVQPAQQSRRTRSGLRLGFLFVTLSAIGMFGLKYTGTYPFNRVLTPMQVMVAAQDKMMAAFTSRALKEKPDFKATIEAVVKEEGTEDPTAMSMHAAMQAGKTKVNWPTVTFTFEAQQGKQTKLQKQLEKMWDGIVKLQCQHAQDDDCNKMSDMVKFTQGKKSEHFDNGNLVFASVKMPKGPAESDADKDMGKAFKEHSVRFLAELNLGRTIEDMFDNKDMNVVKLLNGMHVKVASDFASSMFDAAADMQPNPVFKILKGFAKVKTRQEVLYKNDADLGDAFDGIPSFANELDAFKKGLEGGPKEVTQPMANLQKHAESLKGVVVNGLPGKMEVVVEFKNFHPTKLLGAILKDGK